MVGILRIFQMLRKLRVKWAWKRSNTWRLHAAIIQSIIIRDPLHYLTRVTSVSTSDTGNHPQIR